jgi:hypothetical protein
MPTTTRTLTRHTPTTPTATTIATMTAIPLTVLKPTLKYQSEYAGETQTASLEHLALELIAIE